MNADFDYIAGRIPTYRGYANEDDRHDSIKRVRAIIGESLTDVQLRLGDGLDAAGSAAYESLLFECMFDDQRFVRKIEHASLTPGQLDALVAADRVLVELEERLNGAATPAEFSALISEIQANLAARSTLVASS